MTCPSEADLAVLDALARFGPCGVERLRSACDFDVTGILDRWESIAAGPGGEARAERLLAAVTTARDGSEGFARRLDNLVERGLVRTDGRRFELTAAGETVRRTLP